MSLKNMRIKISPTEVVVKNNFRKCFDIEDLKRNMAANGLLQPIVITPDKFLVAGERRLRAARELGWEKIDCVVREFDTENAQTAAGIFENMKRESYTKSEEMKALAWLKKHWQETKQVTTKEDTGRGKKKNSQSFSFAQKVAKETGRSVNSITEKTRIGERMTPKVAKALDEGEITQKQADQIVRPDDPGERDAVLEQVKSKTFEVTKDVATKSTKRELLLGDAEYMNQAIKLFGDLKKYGQKYAKTLAIIGNSDIMFMGIQRIEAMHIIALVSGKTQVFCKKQNFDRTDASLADSPASPVVEVN
ncbi:MAG: ParB/RepB/Spo0J family partition protein [Bacteriovoracia bacterium]